MTGALHRVSLSSPDLAASIRFFGDWIGLGKPLLIDDATVMFGDRSRGVRISKPQRTLSRTSTGLTAPVGARHIAIEVADLSRVADRLSRASIPFVEADRGDFSVPALYTLDPALNLVAFCGRSSAQAGGLQPWEKAWGWGLHHVNLPAYDVREAVAFYVEIAGLAEGRWTAPASMGDFSLDTTKLAILPLGEPNRGLHINCPDAGFALRNKFAHNPSVGGHPALFVADVRAVKARLEAAGVVVTDAGVYAMAGMHQTYALDPAATVIEINQYVSAV